jgi:7-carboxy-7-deazaguanine synthase
VLPEQWSRTAERLTAVEIADRAAKIAGEWVTLSGGNPAMYDLSVLVFELREHGLKVSVETQGATWQDWLRVVHQVVVSPKPPSSGMDSKAGRDFPAFSEALWNSWLNDGAPDAQWPALKIVVFDEADLTWARQTWADHWIEDQPLYLSVGTPAPLPDEPLAVTRRQVCDRLAWLMERVAAGSDVFDERVLPQLHVLAYGHARGV